MNDQAFKALLLLNRLSGLHAKNIGELLSLFGTPDVLLDQGTLRELSSLNAAGKRLADRIRREQNVFDAEEELRLIEKNNVAIIGFEDERYPRSLLEIADPPLLLYQRGLCDLSVESLSIVGSRNASFYGLEIATAFARDCAEHNIQVVSGFAKGIDAAAHRGALAAGGRTVAVLGCGVDIIYPRSHAGLHEQIIEHGALISEFSMGTEPFGYNFPQRNRIIAGLARGVLVVEASPRSGSLITARLALEEGREVYSIPGKINYEGAKGTNRLLREGARFVESIEDILEDYPGCTREKEAARQPCTVEREYAFQSLSLNEQQVLALISSTPKSADDIGRDLTLPLNTLQTILTQLELKRVIIKKIGGAFVLPDK